MVNDSISELITPHANVTVENITSKIEDKTVMCVVGTKGSVIFRNQGWLKCLKKRVTYVPY